MGDLQDHLRTALADRYRIERELGSGGMASVYLAEDLRHHRPVALKVLRPEIAAAIGPERFLREIEIAARLTHPHILPLHDSGAAGALPWYVMPYVAGATLRERLARDGQLGVDEALAIAADLARALEFAHQHGVVHRDVKPDNVLLEDGEAVLGDFGIAHALDLAGGRKLTRTGVALGTPAYMSPEQHRGDPADARSDLYALGCVLYEMLGGQPPYTGPSTEVIGNQHLNAPVPDVAALRPSAPEGVRTLLGRLLAKTPADRYASAAQAAEAIARCREMPGTGPGAHVPTPPEPAGDAGREGPGRDTGSGQEPSIPAWAQWTAGVLTAAVIVTALGWWVWRITHPPTPAEPTRIAILPFSVHGREDLAYLGDGMATLLTTTLDGVAGLSCVDPNALLLWVRHEKPAAIDERVGGALAGRFSAALFVLGDVVEVGAKLRLQAALYERSIAPRLVARVAVEGLPDSLTHLVDRLVRDLVAEGRPGVAQSRLTSVAARTTTSVPALRAFLEGEREFRFGLLPKATEAYGLAVELDSTFALGWYRYGMAGGFAGSGIYRTAWHRVTMLDRAARYADRLSDRDREIVLAYRDIGLGDLDSGERRYLRVLGNHPDDVEALTWLAWNLFHVNGTRGRSPLETYPFLQRRRQVDPHPVGATGMLMGLCAMTGRWEGIDSLLRETLPRIPEGHARQELLALRGLYLGTPAEQDSIARVQAGLGAGTSVLIPDLIHLVLFGEHLETARRLMALAGPHPYRDMFDLGAGHFHPRMLREESRTLALPLLGCTFVLSNITDADRESARAWIERLPVDDSYGFQSLERPTPAEPGHVTISSLYREYLLGVLSARLGDFDRALEHARRLDGQPDDWDTGAMRDYPASIRATVRYMQGRHHEGLAEIEAAPMRAPMLSMNAVWNRCYERYLRAELNLAAGNLDEALRWFSTLPYSGNAGVVYLAPAHLRQAQIHERLGHRDEAISHYRRFVELWKDCDPALRPEVERARQRLAALEARRS